MSVHLIDSNVLLDILTEDERWFDWSSNAIAEAIDKGITAVNPIIYAEVSIGFDRIEDLEEALPPSHFRRFPLPWDAGFLAGKAFMSYRKSKGAKRSPLPDFYIGAHASIEGMTLVTRDAARYRTYFPKLKLVAPNF